VTVPTRGLVFAGINKTPPSVPSDRLAGVLSHAQNDFQRFVLVLVCVHALSGTDIRCLLLTDLDLSRERLVVRRPGKRHIIYLDELTYRCASAWIRERHRRWPVTSNPHLLINRWTAVDTTFSPIGTTFSSLFRPTGLTMPTLRQEAPPGVDLDAFAYVSRPGALKEGTPFFLDSQMRPAEPLVSFFLEMAKTLKAKSLQDYTYDALDLTEFLENELDPPVDLLSVIEEDLVAYREDCTEHRASPDAPATWKRRRAMINGFYGWAEDQRLIEKRPYFRRRNGRDVLSWGATTQLDVCHLTWRQWNFFKQIGLRGYLPNGRVDRTFRGRSPLRNSAAPELAITTGMRLQEFSCLLEHVRDLAPGGAQLHRLAEADAPGRVNFCSALECGTAGVLGGRHTWNA
jgi:integrase